MGIARAVVLQLTLHTHISVANKYFGKHLTSHQEAPSVWPNFVPIRLHILLSYSKNDLMTQRFFYLMKISFTNCMNSKRISVKNMHKISKFGTWAELSKLNCIRCTLYYRHFGLYTLDDGKATTRLSKSLKVCWWSFALVAFFSSSKKSLGKCGLCNLNFLMGVGFV